MLLLIRHTEDFFRHASPAQSFSDCMLVRAATGQDSAHPGEPALVQRLAAWLETHPRERAAAIHATTACCALCRAEGCRLRAAPPRAALPPGLLARSPAFPPGQAGHA